MKVKYQITMEVEVEVDLELASFSDIGQNLASYARQGMERHNVWTVDKLVVKKTGATGVTPKVIKKARFTPAKTRTFYPHRRRTQ